MKRLPLLAFALFLQVASAHGAKPLSVLFVGNSYTYFNNLPQMFEKIVSPQRPVVTAMLAPGGMTLEGHLMAPKLDALLKSRKWDFVVIQEQSSLTNSFSVDGVSRIVDHRRFWESVHKIVAQVRARGAKPVLYMTWKRKAAPSRDQDFLDFAYSRIGQIEHCPVAPVGRAWSRFQAKNPKAELYYEDGTHPSEVGTYIAAATLAATIAKIDLSRLPLSLSYFPIDLESEKVAATPKTVHFSSARARAVAAAVRSAMAAPAPRREPGRILEPMVEWRTAVSLRDLSGSYSGSTTAFSANPLRMQLNLDDQGYGIASILLGVNQPDLSAAVHLNVKGGIVRFEIPNGPGGAALSFRGTLSGGRLTGICERIYRVGFTVRSEYGTRTVKAGDLAGFGHWSVVRSGLPREHPRAVSTRPRCQERA